jgi:hypothetical protein
MHAPSSPEDKSPSSSAILAELLTEDSDEVDENSTVSQARRAYRAAAAVLASFDPVRLIPFPASADANRSRWTELLSDCESVEIATGGGVWRLRDPIRRETLRQLESRKAMREALSANPQRSEEPLQRAIEWIINDDDLDLKSLTREELAALAVSREWFQGILTTPNDFAIQSAIPVAEVLSPLVRLESGGFVGRESELEVLEDHVEFLASRSLQSSLRRGFHALAYSFLDRPPLFVYGPGGVGKSTLLAHFILTHMRQSDAENLPFVYLDIDRPSLDPRRPLTFLLETIRQLAVQFPAAGAKLEDLNAAIRTSIRRFDASETLKSDLSGEQEQYVGMFAPWAKDNLPRDMPLLLVVDTFEEVQFLGPAVVAVVWDFLEALQSQFPRLRIVVAGRARPDNVNHSPLIVPELDKESGRALIRNHVPALMKSEVDEIIDLVGRNPMALRLAAQLVADAGLDSLRSVETKHLLFLRLKNEKIQAQLYGRILAHIHDDDVRKLAFPGLVVRRVTPSIIRDVLAGPCGVKLSTPSAADELFDKLAQEIALFERDGDRAVRHRIDVRRMMLADLLSRVPQETVNEIDRNAVAYYRGLQDDMARAEEIYHALRLGEPTEKLGRRWTAHVGDYLRSAIEELPPAQQIWLSTKLGVRPDKKVLALASLASWEERTAEDARQLLTANAPQRVLTLLSERKERTPGSVLYRIEAEAYRLLGDDARARVVAERGYKSASTIGNVEVAFELQLVLAAIEESNDQLDAAFYILDDLISLCDDSVSALTRLRVLVTRIRVGRKRPEFDLRHADLRDRANEILRTLSQQQLRSHPALLREVAAELGDRDYALLRSALEIVGLELGDDDSRRAIAIELGALTSFKWDSGPEAGRSFEAALPPDEFLATYYEGRLLPNDYARRLTTWLLRHFRDVAQNPELVDIILNAFRHDVGKSIQVRQRPKPSRRRRLK